MSGSTRRHAVWLCASNADDSFPPAIESLLAELAARGAAPLLVFTQSPPFRHPAPLTMPKDQPARSFDYYTYYTSARVPAIRLDDLLRHLADPRRRDLFLAEGARHGMVLVAAPAIPAEGLPTVADAAVLFLAKGPAVVDWAYQAARTLVAKNTDLPIAVVALNTRYLEEAAVFFHDVRGEVEALLQQEVRFHFAGYLNLDSDCGETAAGGKRSGVARFCRGAVHGQVKYVLKAISAAAAGPPREPYFSRLAALISEGPEKAPKR